MTQKRLSYPQFELAASTPSTPVHCVPANSKRWGSFRIKLAAAELVGWTGGFAVVR